MFTLAHELSHLWLGESALSDVGPVTTPSNEIERWCNAVAAELFIPIEALRASLRPRETLHETLDRLAREFKVSTLVILRRLYDAGKLAREELNAEYEAELTRLRGIPRASGGDFYLTVAARVGNRFARAVVTATWEGRSSFTEACRLQEDGHLPRAEQQAGSERLMAYLINANVFIASKNLQYGLDFCPASWDWLAREHDAGKVFSIEKAGDELRAGQDELADWATRLPAAFFHRPDAATLPALGKVANWVNGQANYSPAAKSTFLQIADYCLVAQTLAGSHSVAIHERPENSVHRESRFRTSVSGLE